METKRFKTVKLRHKAKTLNKKTYYNISTDRYYQSPTFFKKFLSCEAEAFAELQLNYKPDSDSTPLIVGNYLHSYFESSKAHQAFIDQHKSDIVTRSGTLRAPYQQAETMIDTLSSDKMFKKLYKGRKEVIVRGKINDIDWKGKIDCLNLERGYFIDLKTTRDINKKYWNNDEHSWESFVAAYNYQLQMYVYQQLIYQQYGVMCVPYIVAVTKEKVPAKAIISISDERLQEAEYQIDGVQEHIEDVRNGIVKPTRCEHCDYCKSTAILNDIVDMDDLIE
nr:PD-(D/E)XK nuclease-like domain-containing protein [Companilactobacillus bobalius]